MGVELSSLARDVLRERADQSRAMREVLTEISMAEHAAGRPLLSAVVVRTDTRRPGKGFEAMAKLLRVRGRSSPQTFWKMQRDRVWKHVWTQR